MIMYINLHKTYRSQYRGNTKNIIEKNIHLCDISSPYIIFCFPRNWKKRTSAKGMTRTLMFL